MHDADVDPILRYADLRMRFVARRVQAGQDSRPADGPVKSLTVISNDGKIPRLAYSRNSFNTRTPRRFPSATMRAWSREVRIERARAWLEARERDEELLIVGATVDAAQQDSACVEITGVRARAQPASATFTLRPAPSTYHM
jgi:hypothetical protein